MTSLEPRFAEGPTRSMLVVTTMPGTITAFLLPYLERMRALGWRVDAATGFEAGGDGVADHVDTVWRVRWSRRMTDPRNPTSAFWAARRLLARQRYDIVHTHTPVASLIVRLAVGSLPPSRRPVVVYTAHGLHFGRSVDERWVHRLIVAAERLAGRWTDRLVVINTEDVDNAVGRRVLPPERVVYVPGIGVDPNRFRPSTEVDARAGELRRSLGLADGDALFAMVAHFDARKNHRCVLRAMGHLGRPDVHVAFAGTGALEQELRDEVSAAGLGDRIHFLGAMADVRPLVRAATALLLPSYQEGLSRAVLESLSLGVPVIGSNIRGIADLVAPGGGILIEPDDHAGLADAMNELARDQASHFDPAAVNARLAAYAVGPLVDRHVDLYESLLGQRRAEEMQLR